MNYKKIYENLIERAKTRDLGGVSYYEKHHIIPRCMGGGNEKSNLVKLTPEEHVVAHLLLVKIFPNVNKLLYAANMMTNRVKNNKHYGWLKREMSKLFSEKFKRPRSKESIEKQRVTIKEKYKNGFICPAVGRKLTDEHKVAISNANNGKKIPIKSRCSLEGYILRYGEEVGAEKYEHDRKNKDSNSLEFFIRKYGEELGAIKYHEKCKRKSDFMSGENSPSFGKKHSNQTRRKISESNTGRPKKRTADHNQRIGDANRGKKQDLVSCPHCGKIGGRITMQQWHFDNCKRNPNGPIKVRKVQPVITCPHCKKSGNGPRMKSDHFDKCKSKDT